MDQNERGMDMFPFYVVVVGGKNMKLLNNPGTCSVLSALLT
jgi:hypothetical protein